MTDTVKSLARQVAAGTLDPLEAGRRMRPLVTHHKLATTLAEKREGYNELAIDLDPNSWIAVEALRGAGVLDAKDYWVIRQGLGVGE